MHGSSAGEKQRVRVNVMYNIHGLLQIQSAQLMEEVPPEPTPAPQAEEKKEEAAPADGRDSDTLPCDGFMSRWPASEVWYGLACDDVTGAAAPEGEAPKEGAAAPSSPAKEAAPAPATPKKKFRKVTLNVSALVVAEEMEEDTEETG